MARARYQVFVIPYCIDNGKAQFCLFRRRDIGIWQFIAGGGEDEDISIIKTAKREAFEEAGISRLVTFSSSIPAAAYPPTALRTQKQYGEKSVLSFRSTHLR